MASLSKLLGQPWMRGLFVALALLLLPVFAWIAIPSRSAPIAANASAPVGSAGLLDEEGDPVDARRKISGHVVADDGSPVAGATVTLTRDKLSVGNKTTDRNGAFSFTSADGQLEVRATRAGFAPSTTSVPAGGDIADLEVTLSKVAGVSGTVIDGEGNAVARAHVACDGDQGQGATTNEAGKFSLPADAVGCLATASHPDHGTSPAVSMRAGNRNVITMASPGKISGNVVDETGRAISGATVAVESFVPVSGDGGPFFKQKTADNDGAFVLDDLAPGKYVLVASAAGKPPTKTRSIELSSGESSRGNTITLTKGGTLSGVVTDRETGAPIVGARVSLDAATVSGASASGTATTDADGNYSLAGVPASAFSVRFRHNDYADRILSVDPTSGALKQNVDLAKRGAAGGLELTGIGATLLMGGKFVEVAGVIEGGPAKAAGVLTGDRIEAIDGRSAEGLSVSDCVQKLRGAEGTRVSVTLGRGTQKIDVTMTRAKIVR